jgi:hypothetical protein
MTKTLYRATQWQIVLMVLVGLGASNLVAAQTEKLAQEQITVADYARNAALSW